jgi:hypothetical protein
MLRDEGDVPKLLDSYSSCPRSYFRKPSKGVLVEKGIFTKEEFLEIVRVVGREIKRK